MADTNPPQNSQPAAPVAPASAPATQTSIPVASAPSQTTGTVAVMPPKKSSSKKVLIGCGGGFAFLIILALVLTFIFLGSPSAARSPLAEALGVDPYTLVTWITTAQRIFFAVLSFALFIAAMISIFRFAGTKKDDPNRKSVAAAAAITAVVLILNLFLWAGSELYLYSKLSSIQKTIKVVPMIAVDPIDTKNLVAPVTVTFDASGIKAQLDKAKINVINYEWDFGDGAKDNGAKVTHEYKDKGKANGVFEAVLAVRYKDLTGKEYVASPKDPKSMAKFVQYETVGITVVNVKPVVDIKADPEKGEAPLIVNFDASGSKDDGKIVSYAWDFEGTGDDRLFTDSVNQVTTHSFTKVGEYTVKLKVTDNEKAETIAEKKIVVEEAKTPRPSIKVQAEASGKFIAGKVYLFDGSESVSPAGTVQKYEWDFGDGTKASSKMISHSFAQTGDYNISLKITDSTKLTGELSQKVTVVGAPKAPVAVIKTAPAKASEQAKTLEGKLPFEVSFDASSSTDQDNNITEYKWDFGDASANEFGPTAKHSYEKEGTFKAILTIKDADNNESTATLQIIVKPAGIQAKIDADKVSGATPLSVSFDASGSTYKNGQIISYEWNFGDGTPKRLDNAKLTYKYAKIGTFTASVTAIGADNTRDTAQVLITVTPVALKACFNATKHEGKAPLTVVFTSCSTGTVSKFKWDLNGDGNFDDATGPEVTHIFDNPGEYNVSLEVSDLSGVTDTNKDLIKVLAP
ncbi:MAG: PKD domain-containing protein [Candidatus Gracilibacteria bacterium]